MIQSLGGIEQITIFIGPNRVLTEAFPLQTTRSGPYWRCHNPLNGWIAGIPRISVVFRSASHAQELAAIIIAPRANA
jgi:hypothetical protein